MAMLAHRAPGAVVYGERRFNAFKNDGFNERVTG